jgi:Zn-dependent protease
VKLMTLFGIRIGADLSWFLVLFFVIITLSSAFRDALTVSDRTAYITAVACALLLFASFVIHEMGHALAARRLGIPVVGIDLFLFGGLTKMTRESNSPGEEFKVAAAGPVATLGVIVACLGVDMAIVGPSKLLDAALLRDNVNVTPALLALTWLVNMNVILFVFNLIPAFPLDGGRILRAAVWRFTGDRRRATKSASTVGLTFAYLLGGLGIFVLLRYGAIDGIWLMVLGLFLGQGARGALLQTAFSERIGGVRVADIMDRQPVTVPSDLPVERALDEFFLRYRWPWFPVVDAVGRFVGLVREDRVRAAQQASPPLTVSSVTDSERADTLRVEEEAPLEALIGSEGLRDLGAVMAVDRDGVLRGVVTVEAVQRALRNVLAS